jgi:hypothetical protein
MTFSKPTSLLSLIPAAFILITLLLGASAATNAEAADEFSFIAYGDSRSMMYLPYEEAEKEKIHTALVNIFTLILGEKIAEEIVKAKSKIEFDPASGELRIVEMPFVTKSEIARLRFDKGWVIEATVEDIKLAPGVETVMYRNFGGDWVSDSVAREVAGGNAKFVVNSGDVVWWGARGRTLETSG